MGTKDITVNTYVDIATTLARQLRPYGELRTNPKDVMARGNFASIWGIRQDWEKRINRWQEEVHGRRTSIKSINLRDMRIGTLFLQHPITGMMVWNILQACYELDRIVCLGPNLEQLITRWEELPLLQYLDNPEIEKRWKEFLGDMQATISEKKKHVGQPTENALLIFKKDENRKTPGVEERISAIAYGVDNLEDRWYELSKSFQVSPDMKDSVVAKEMLDAIETSIVGKFAMISTALKDKSSSAVTTDDSIQTQPEPTPTPRLLSKKDPSNIFQTMMQKLISECEKIVVGVVFEKNKGATITAIVLVGILVWGLSFAQIYLEQSVQ